MSITVIYNKTGIRNRKKALENILESNKEKCINMGGDLKARIGTLGSEDSKGFKGIKSKKYNGKISIVEGARWIIAEREADFSY